MIGNKQQKIDDLKETEKIVTSLLQHYAFILEHVDEKMAELDKEIDVLKEKKEYIWSHFVEAPEQLIKLKQQLQEIQDKRQAVKTTEKDKTERIQRIKNRVAKLRERLGQLENEDN